jgi:hypothetical protein
MQGNPQIWVETWGKSGYDVSKIFHRIGSKTEQKR